MTKPDTNIRREPLIRVEGELLTDAQAMTLRVAMESFASSLYTDGLGEDEHGKVMAVAYLNRIDEIRKIMGIYEN